jgi:hypothetical protein
MPSKQEIVMSLAILTWIGVCFYVYQFVGSLVLLAILFGGLFLIGEIDDRMWCDAI